VQEESCVIEQEDCTRRLLKPWINWILLNRVDRYWRGIKGKEGIPNSPPPKIPITSCLHVDGSPPQKLMRLPLAGHSSPCIVISCICTTFLLTAKYRAIACSATASLDAAGTFETVTPRALHASRSIMSVPIAIAATSLRFGHAWSVCAVIGTLREC
jgi:hypothetical protein